MVLPDQRKTTTNHKPNTALRQLLPTVYLFTSGGSAVISVHSAPGRVGGTPLGGRAGRSPHLGGRVYRLGGRASRLGGRARLRPARVVRLGALVSRPRCLVGEGTMPALPGLRSLVCLGGRASRPPRRARLRPARVVRLGALASRPRCLVGEGTMPALPCLRSLVCLGARASRLFHLLV